MFDCFFGVVLFGVVSASFGGSLACCCWFGVFDCPFGVVLFGVVSASSGGFLDFSLESRLLLWLVSLDLLLSFLAFQDQSLILYLPLLVKLIPQIH